MNIKEVLFYSFRRFSTPKCLMALELYYTNILKRYFGSVFCLHPPMTRSTFVRIWPLYTGTVLFGCPI